MVKGNGTMEDKLDQILERLVEMDERFDKFDAHLRLLILAIRALDDKFNSLDRRVKELE